MKSMKNLNSNKNVKPFLTSIDMYLYFYVNINDSNFELYNQINLNMCEYFRKYLKKEQYGNHQYFPLFSSNIKFKTLFKNSILDSMKKRGWKECEDDTNWDIMWAEKEWIHDVMD